MEQSAIVAAAEPSDDKHPYTPDVSALEKRLKRRIDFLLLPILTISYGLQFYDKAVLGSASVFGIIPDLGLSQQVNGRTVTTRYSTATSSFYWGYIVGVLPFALLLQRLPIARTLGVLIMLWGLICLLTIVVSSYAGLVTQRFFLGLVESTVSPGFLIISNRWYKKSELATRVGIWYSATGLFSMFSGILNFGIGQANGPRPVWQYIYIFAGSVTILHGMIVFVILPDSIASAKRLFNEEERAFLAKRIEEDQQGASDQRFHRDQLIEGLLDPKIWFFMLMGAAIYVSNGGVTAFGARIIQTFGYSPAVAILLQIPGGACTCISIYIAGWIVGRYRNITTYVLATSCIPVIVGAIVIWQSDWSNRAAPIIGYTLLPVFGAPYVMVLALSTYNISGGTKKALSAGAIFIGYNVGNIIAPYTIFTPEATQHYRSTWIAIISSMGATIVMALLLRLYLIRENQRKDREEEGATAALAEKARSSLSLDDKEDPSRHALQVLARDLSDRQNPFMRYTL